MVAKIWTSESEANLGEDFRQETKCMMEKVALEHNCNVEELKFTVDNTGVVNIQRMTPQEILNRESKRIVDKMIKQIRKSRGVSNG